jgi:peroxiredoxin Q/BCP
MAQLRRDYQQFVDLDCEVLILGPEGAAAFKRVWEMEDMPMPGLSDPGSQVADRFQQEVNLLKLGRMPALLVIDKQGMIRFIHYGRSMADIPENKIVLNILEGIENPAFVS